ncbi:glutathione S-transferase family protein [Caulobacter segnis]|uniref:glutathione S-transferase family protein n=1 Tax=Caulobacter segnis TaxID=88688 RepID=UPI001CBC52F9|nr:glutathione S-transferase family protein [Caulobacter segnis]UAL11918.1 glutathione S-transferase family protein [Caulobacter segnis]
MELVIGTKAWSTWSLRPWLALKRTGASFKEIEIALRRGDATTADIAAYSPSRLAPALKDGDLVVWDSLAICEYLAEKFPDAKLWPDDPALRALGRSAAAEMHSGFQSLRGECPMALEEAPRKLDISEATQKDVRKIVERWNQLLERSGGPFLLGEWSIVDAFYTPVATRFRGYEIRLSDYGDTGAAGAYAERLLETPEFLEWERAAKG